MAHSTTMPRVLAGVAFAALLALLGGCDTLLERDFPPSPIETGAIAPGEAKVLQPDYQASPTTTTDAAVYPSLPAQRMDVQAGTGRFVSVTPSRSPPSAAAAGDVTLNFEGATVAEVAKLILGDLLGFNYSIQPGVQGTVVLQTNRPLAREALLPTLELMLRSNGAALVREGDTYSIVPSEQANRAQVVPQLGGGEPIPPGHSVRIVPLRYVAASEIAQILEPLARIDNVVRVDATRNLLVVSGTAAEVDRLVETVKATRCRSRVNSSSRPTSTPTSSTASSTATPACCCQ